MNAEIVLIKNTVVKMDQHFCEAYNIFSKLKLEILDTSKWDDVQKQNLEKIIEELNINFQTSKEKMLNYLTQLNDKLSELQNG